MFTENETDNHLLLDTEELVITSIRQTLDVSGIRPTNNAVINVIIEMLEFENDIVQCDIYRNCLEVLRRNTVLYS